MGRKETVMEMIERTYEKGEHMEWKDIKFAPRNRFILATPCFGTSNAVYQIYWVDGKRKSGWKFGTTWLTAEPKFWMELPEPPKPTEQETLL